MAKAKGANFLPAVKALRSRRAQALAALPPALHHYLGERISVAAWYPEADLLALLTALAKTLPPGALPPGADVYEFFGTIAAREHIEGIYAHLLESPNPRSLPPRVIALWNSQHDTGRLEFRLAGAGRAELELSGYASSCREMCDLIGGYFREVMRSTGLSSSKIAKRECCNRGGARCIWECVWEESDA